MWWVSCLHTVFIHTVSCWLSLHVPQTEQLAVSKWRPVPRQTTWRFTAPRCANRTKQARAIKKLLRKAPRKGTWTVITDTPMPPTAEHNTAWLCPNCYLSTTWQARQQLSLYTETA
jgi:predicted RNA-binding Zn-ribbon protein involved in translation (DUF1610 family)